MALAAGAWRGVRSGPLVQSGAGAGDLGRGNYAVSYPLKYPHTFLISHIDINMSARRPHPGLASTHLSVLHRVTYLPHREQHAHASRVRRYAGKPPSLFTHDHRVAVQQAPARTSPEIDYRPEDPNRGHHQPIQKTTPSVRHLRPRRPFKSQPPPPPLQYSRVRRRRRN